MNLKTWINVKNWANLNETRVMIKDHKKILENAQLKYMKLWNLDDIEFECHYSEKNFQQNVHKKKA